MRTANLLALATLVLTTHCSGSSTDTGDDAGLGGSSATGGTGGSAEGGTGGSTAGGTGGTGVGGTGVGGTGVGGTGGSAGEGGSAGSTGGSGACAGYGGVGGQPPRCDDGTLYWEEQTSEGYCHFQETCSGDTPACVYNEYHVPSCQACPDSGGGPMVSVGDSCVDATEVTRGDYEAWLATSPSAGAQLSACSWNGSFEPDLLCMAGADVCATGCAAHPQVCVDWCDAYAYCAAVGKRLCGIYPPSDFESAWAHEDLAELREACDAGEDEKYPYGSTHKANACNGSDLGKGTTVAAGSLANCARTHADGVIFDTTGNVWEWEDACAGGSGAADFCRLRGGSFVESGMTSTCDRVDKARTRDAVASNVGFRCCGP